MCSHQTFIYSPVIVMFNTIILYIYHTYTPKKHVSFMKQPFLCPRHTYNEAYDQVSMLEHQVDVNMEMTKYKQWLKAVFFLN